ncbi:MAG: GNAT family N-acetyltransferase [Akkermansiaceae bacterium]|jgi:ribosomal protein S18 acetylase RimI-like enzyme|nr:GNAT family N-acetyltransferase [Akkermansiaceae bacterium]
MSEPPQYQILPLNTSVHHRTDFDCGEPQLDRYFREQASQDIKRKVAGCWVLVSRDSPKSVMGFYTLSTEVVDMKQLGDADPDVAKRLPRYPRLGAVLLGRLAVAKTAQKQGLGELLLFDAMHRTLNAQIPAALMITDPKDGKAAAFYRKYGFRPLNPERLFITAQQLQVILGKRD